MIMMGSLVKQNTKFSHKIKSHQILISVFYRLSDFGLGDNLAVPTHLCVYALNAINFFCIFPFFHPAFLRTPVDSGYCSVLCFYAFVINGCCNFFLSVYVISVYLLLSFLYPCVSVVIQIHLTSV